MIIFYTSSLLIISSFLVVGTYVIWFISHQTARLLIKHTKIEWKQYRNTYLNFWISRDRYILGIHFEFTMEASKTLCSTILNESKSLWGLPTHYANTTTHFPKKCIVVVSDTSMHCRNGSKPYTTYRYSLSGPWPLQNTTM